MPLSKRAVKQFRHPVRGGETGQGRRQFRPSALFLIFRNSSGGSGIVTDCNAVQLLPEWCA